MNHDCLSRLANRDKSKQATTTREEVHLLLSKVVQKISVLERQKKVSFPQLKQLTPTFIGDTRAIMRGRDKSVESDGDASLSNVNAIKMIPMD